ncbi:MAG: response regulator transcription factor [Chloroflexi bacterium]|nr:response regulator transcription factor [Chloroflexota bacterium]
MARFSPAKWLIPLDCTREARRSVGLVPSGQAPLVPIGSRGGPRRAIREAAAALCLSRVLRARNGGLDQMAAVAMAEHRIPHPSRWPLAQGLTDRQLEILRLVAAGKSNREIGSTLDLSENTVRNHLQAIYNKLGVRQRTLAVLAAALTNQLALADLLDRVGRSTIRPYLVTPLGRSSDAAAATNSTKGRRGPSDESRRGATRRRLSTLASRRAR